jgi:hypothetical protein
MSRNKALMLRVRVAIERAEQHLIAENVVANARSAANELIAAYRMKPEIAVFISERWRAIEEFLNSRNRNSTIISISGIETFALREAWSAFEEIEVTISV